MMAISVQLSSPVQLIFRIKVIINQACTLTAHSQTKSTLIFEAIFWSNPRSILVKFGRFTEAEAKTADPRCHRGRGLGRSLDRGGAQRRVGSHGRVQRLFARKMTLRNAFFITVLFNDRLLLTKTFSPKLHKSDKKYERLSIKFSNKSSELYA